jgi:diguanylate cyclase (GGDEF)-like protein
MILIASGYFALNAFQINQKNEIQQIQDQGQKLAASFDHELNVQTVSLKILAAEAQSVIDGDFISKEITTANLVPVSDHQGFSLSIPEGTGEDQIGNLTGFGEIPIHGSPLAREMDMALSLSPAFEQIIRNNSTLPWVYYTSVHKFIYMYPRVSIDEFFYKDVLLETEYFVIATPKNDPERKLVWSSPYEDQAGAGQMVTVSYPIYEEDQFLGVLSIDILSSDLEWILKSGTLQNINSYLVGPDGEDIVNSGEKEFSLDISKFQPGEFSEFDGKFYAIFPLNEVKWAVVLEIDKSQIRLNAVKSSADEIIIFLFVFFCILLILITYHNMRSARFMAIHDDLTGMLNRRSFDELSLKVLQRKAPNNPFLGIAVIDIDHFKQYNDLYGHVAGDEIIRQVAAVLKSCLRNSTDLLYRVGGEEFVIMLILASPGDLQQVLERLVNEVSALCIPHADSSFGHVTVSSGGIVTKFDSVVTIEEVYRKADIALYLAKESGRNCWMIT